MNTNYRIIKLSNGENIICNIKDQNESDIMIEVTAPLKMDIMSHVTEEGVVEGLSLTRWIQPFTDEKNIPINKATIVTMVPASLGMSRYYEYVLKGIKGIPLTTTTPEDIEEEPTSEELEQIELEESYEFLKRHTRTIH